MLGGGVWGWHAGITNRMGVRQVPALGLVQILATCGWLEYKMHGGKMSADNMFEDGRAPGDFGEFLASSRNLA